MSGSALKQQVASVLSRMDLTQAADRAVKTYSGGMQRRLDVALGMVHRPSVLFLDEPTTGLDPEARAALWQEISKLSADDGLTILLTTHYLEEADRLAARLALVDKGKVVAAGTPDAMKNQLRGDAVHIQLGALPAAAEQEQLRAAIAAVQGVQEISLDGRRLSARADDGAAAVPAVLAALDRAGALVAAVTVARPSLDDVYLRHVGRRFGESDTETDQADYVAGGIR